MEIAQLLGKFHRGGCETAADETAVRIADKLRGIREAWVRSDGGKVINLHYILQVHAPLDHRKCM